jgi:hypothetical protein
MLPRVEERWQFGEPSNYCRQGGYQTHPRSKLAESLP